MNLQQITQVLLNQSKENLTNKETLKREIEPYLHLTSYTEYRNIRPSGRLYIGTICNVLIKLTYCNPVP